MKTTIQTFQILALVILLILVISLIQTDNFYKNNFNPFPVSKAKTIPFYTSLSALSGFKVLVADFLWMDIVQYIGDKENEKIKYKELYPKVSNLITVDPNFTYVYLAASGMMLFELNEPDKAIELIKTGIQNNPRYWQLNLYLAAYTYSKLGNPKMVVHNIESAIEQEGHPPMLERILGSMYLKLAMQEKTNEKFWLKKAVTLWLNMYAHPLEKLNKTYAEDHLRKFGLLK
jgi:tetratricopeptide (TPR) repeat protein